MPLHPELTAVAAVALVALVCGVAMARLGQSAVVGYILAGVVLGPSALGLVTDRAAVGLLAEFGVLLLLFLVGMELDLRRFVSVWKVAVSATAMQVAGSLGVMLLMRLLLGWSLAVAVLLAFVVALSSTAVVIKTLESSGELSTEAGRVTLGVLVAQDMAVVPMALVLDGLGGGGFSPVEIGRLVFSVVFLVLLVLLMVRRQVRLPFASTVTGDGDLTPLAGLAWCFGAAALAGLLNLSPAYGAFLAGLVIGNSAQSAAILRATHPIQSVLLMVFFLSIGLLLDLGFIWRNLGIVLMMLAVVVGFKTALNIFAIRLLGRRWPVALLAGVAMAQIGEFSFLLSETGRSYGLISAEEARLVVAVTVLSLALTPLWLAAARWLHDLAQSGITTLQDSPFDRDTPRLVRLAGRLGRRRRLGDGDAGS